MSSKTTLFIFIGIILLATAGAVPPQSGERAYDALKAEAEKYYAEKSFTRARDLYVEAAKLQLPDADRRWVEMRIADATWRADAPSPAPDPTAREKARADLERIIHDTPADARDLVFAEANESLGDYYATHPYHRNVHNGQPYYVAALDWWAGGDDIAMARRRYLDIVWKMTPEGQTWNVPREVLVNATKIAESPADRAHARFLLATQLLDQRTPANVERGVELLDEILREGRKTEWYDDALFRSAMALAESEDYARALERFRRLVAEFQPSETPHHEEARDAIRDITQPSVDVQVATTFLPESEQEAILHWRNVKQVELALHAVDLTKDTRFDPKKEWIESIDIEPRAQVRRWTFDTNDKGEHRPGFERMHLNPRLEPGAYLLTARAGEQSARALVLITDAHILVHAGRGRMHVFVSDVVTGEPIANARVRAWSPRNSDETKAQTARTNGEGIAEVVVPEGGNAFITASAGMARQAFHQGWFYGYYGRTNERQWRIYAFTDRPAYRPDETVQWKIIARVREGERWVTPAGQSLTYEINSPRGEKVASGTARLNAFGSFWSELPLEASMALGAYQITFRSGDHHAASAQLFRLEEYKLPEFLVNVSTPEGKQYRLGETIEATIEASYYFGGPVANAEVEAVIHQQAFVRHWHPWREYHWYWRGIMPPPQESVVMRESLRTDAAGRATLRIETQRDGADTSYRIEARVVDASRREVRGEGTVRVTRQRYSVMAHPEHYVHRPGESASVKFKAMDANDKPVQTTGTVKVVKRTWREPGPIVPLARERRRLPRPRYVEEEILTTQLSTDAEGEATLTFAPKTTGYYAVRWQSVDGDPKRAQDLVNAETTIWVADPKTTDLGFRAPGLDIIVDKETMRAGQTAIAMVVAPASGRWVVLSSSGDDLIDTQVLHLDGTAKLVQIPVDDRHVPNFFLTASSVFDLQLATDTERIVVPPAEHFLDVDVKSDREQYEPRQEGTVTITTRDVDGKPVPAEVAVSVSDEAVTAIQQDPAGDPRQFFFGETRNQQLRVSAGVQSQRYQKLEEEPPAEEDDEGVVSGVEGFVPGGVVGGVVGGRMEAVTKTAAPAMAVPPPPPAPVARAVALQDAVSEATAGMEVQVRSDFRSTAFWQPDVITDGSGTATVKVKFPEALTTWRATARAATSGSQFGMGSSTSRTQLPLIVRLQAPRFFVVGDEVVVSAVLNNNTDAAMTVLPSLEVEGLTLRDAKSPSIDVPAHGEARANWTVAAEKAGNAKLRVTGRSSRHADAMEKPFFVYEHGIDKLIARSGKLRGSEALIRLELPRERRATELTVQIAPSLAVTMLDALPYLIQYPYGCTEQTMSRFLPAAIVAKTLEKLNLGRARIAGKDLDDVTAKGMARLYDMQHGDGGWGWWKEGDSDPFMTAYVVWGFAIARDGGLRVNESAVNRAVQWLESNLAKRENQHHDQAWMLHATSAWRAKPSAAEKRAYDNVWSHRDRLTAYSRALLALVAHRYGDAERAAVLVRNLEDGAMIDRTPDSSVLLKGETPAGKTAETMATAHWGAQRFWWRWYEGPVETTAFVLQALVTIDPDHRLVEPAMNWLVKNRRGAQWNNTRDTAIAILAFNDYLQRSGELRGDVSYELTVNGHAIASKTITAADVLKAPSRFTVDAKLLGDATQEIRIRRTSGNAPLYFAAEARFVSLEEPVKAAGNEIFVRREYFRLKARPTLLKGILYDRIPLRDGESIPSGERVEVVVTVEAKNDYDYLMFEDLKPGGFEAVALQSGGSLHATETRSKRMVWVYQELRDRKVATFIDHLQQGVWQMSYMLRAETPGSFHALPLLGQAMYVPEVRANGDEVRVKVAE